jgi:Signal peptidase, peptidase S26
MRTPISLRANSLLAGLIIACCSTVASSAILVNVRSDATAAIPASMTTQATAELLARSLDGAWSGVMNTGSMLPTLTARDLIVIRKVDVRELQTGDIIVFDIPARKMAGGRAVQERRLVHRVVQRLDCKKLRGKYRAQSECLRVRTQGDNLKRPDRWLTGQGNLEGKVIYVIDGRTGAIRDMRSSRTGAMISAQEALRRAAPGMQPSPLYAYMLQAIAGS